MLSMCIFLEYGRERDRHIDREKMLESSLESNRFSSSQQNFGLADDRAAAFLHHLVPIFFLYTSVAYGLVGDCHLSLTRLEFTRSFSRLE